MFKYTQRKGTPPLVSIFINSRITDRKDGNLFNLLQSLELGTRNKDLIEVLIKFDFDDDYAKELCEKLGNFSFVIKFIFGPRGRGYVDIHLGYNSLLPLANTYTKIFICMADDFLVVEGWDQILITTFKKCQSDYFIIHQRPHPPTDRPLSTLFKFNPTYNDVNFENLYIVDESPAWSAKLINLVGGFGPTYSTDAWTLALEKTLFQFDRNITYFTKQNIINRILNPAIDLVGSSRWNNERKNNFDYYGSPEFQNEINRQKDLILSQLNRGGG